MKHDETVNEMEEEKEEGEAERDKGDWGLGVGGRGTAYREAINLSLQVSPGTDLPPSSSRSLLTGFNSLEAVEMRVPAPCWSLKEARLSFLFYGPLHNTAAGFTGAIKREREVTICNLTMAGTSHDFCSSEASH